MKWHTATVMFMILVHGCVSTTPTVPPPPLSRATHPRYAPTPVEEQVANQLIKDIRTYGKEVSQLSPQQVSAPTKSVAVVWSPEKTPLLQTVLSRSANVTANTILLEVSDQQLKRSAQALSNIVARDPLFDWIVSAQKMGFRVFLTTPFRSIAGYEVDIFNPEVKKGLLSFYRNIARYPLNGIYMNDISYAMKEGITPYAIATYQDLFSEKLETRLSQTGHSLWRFAGLKSRHLTKLLSEIWAQIQVVSPEMEFGIGVPEILLTDPAKGLMETSLDYLELKEAQFDFYVVASQGTGAQSVSESLLKYGKLDKVWFQRTRKEKITSLLEMPIQGVVISSP